jgi:hypothetical protein
VATTTTAATSSGGEAPSTLFACGSNGNVADDSTQVISLFKAVQAVCCDDWHEECDSKSVLPTTCRRAGCARTVDLVAQSCAAAFAEGFLSAAFKPELDQLVAMCGAAEEDHSPAYVITDPYLHGAPITTCHGRLVDGSASDHPPARTGQDAVILQAPEGMQLKLTAESLYMSPHGNLRVYDDTASTDDELGVLRGTSLPQAQDREFVSSNGALRVLRAVDLRDDVGLPLVFSLRIGCVCAEEPNGCGDHGACVNGICQCADGYSGAMCETNTDPCRSLDCGAHGTCLGGSCECESGEYSGEHCQNFDSCFGIDCGQHGTCTGGSCVCESSAYTGDRCQNFDTCHGVSCGGRAETCRDGACVLCASKLKCPVSYGRWGECSSNSHGYRCSCSSPISDRKYCTSCDC